MRHLGFNSSQLIVRTVRIAACLAVAASFVSTPKSVDAAGIHFSEIARFDVSGASTNDPLAPNPAYIGNNPSAVAWNAQKLYIAGFNSTGTTAGVVEVTNATSTGLQTATYSSAFGVLTTPASRGYSGLDIKGSVLAAAYDDGAADPNGIQAFSTATNTQSWAKSTRGGSGVAFDPGFNGGAGGAGVAWTTFGSGRRALQNTGTGADVFTTANGMIINTGTGTFWRDLDFDPDTGDIYPRRSNGVFKGTRSGDNALSSVTVLVAANGATDGVNGQNVGLLSNTLAGDAIIYNDRANGLSGQSFASVVKVIDPSGAALTSVFDLIGGGSMPNGVGYYDFDFDPATQTLALLDFANRNVHVFQVVPEPATWLMALIGSCGLIVLRRLRTA